MKTKSNKQRGAVLVVALIMLSMVTFLVVAFVGFSRFERASVEASMVRAEASHALEIGLVEAQHDVMDRIRNNINHGLVVSQNEHGAGTFSIPTNHQGLVDFASSLTNSPRVPVYIDRSGDGVQDTFPFYLNFNSATNSSGSGYQPTTNHMGHRYVGDPHWIGLLEKPGQPHGPKNRFVARYAHLTVPVHKALNIRYHHNDLKRKGGNPHFDRFNRAQGNHPQEINLAAPLGIIHSEFFKYGAFNPDRLKNSLPLGIGSAYSFASAFSFFGHEIEDAMHFSRPSKGYNELLSMNRSRNDFNGVAARQFDGLLHWLNSSDPNLNGVRMATPPYSYYQFMELFSSTPLPAESGKFDVNSIRDEFVLGYAAIDSVKDEVLFVRPHGLKSGDKLEPTGLARPAIYDPIRFDVITDNMTDIERQDRLEDLLSEGLVETTVPHHLLHSESVRIILSGIEGGLTWKQNNPPMGQYTKIVPGLTWLQSKNPKGPYRPVITVGIEDIAHYRTALQVFSEAPKPPQPLPSPVLTELRLQTPYETTSPTPIYNFWGDWDGKIGKPKYGARPKLPNGDLPPEFKNVNCTVDYRFEHDRPLDFIPYFVKVITPTSVSLHRSAELNKFSKVDFSSGSDMGLVDYHGSTHSWRAQSKQFDNAIKATGMVRFVVPAGQLGPQPQHRSRIKEEEVFTLKLSKRIVGKGNQHQTEGFFLHDHTGSRIIMGGIGFGYKLKTVYQFRRDRLAETMEKMAGLMLNESIDTTGGSVVDESGNDLGGSQVQHFLGGKALEQFNVANPSALYFGLGGHTKSKGFWHHPKKGIAFPGNYTREAERIVQVAANIADLYSGYAGPNIPFSGDEVLTCKSTGRDLLPFGSYSRDASVSASIRHSDGYSGLVLCVRTEHAKPWGFPAYEIRYVKTPDKKRARVQLWIWAENSDGSPKLVASSSDVGVANPKEFYPIKAECEGGRKITVTFNGEHVLHYEHSRTLIGQSALLAGVSGGTVEFKHLVPGIMPGEIDWPRFISWKPPSRRLLDAAPTTWKGIFQSDERNNVYLTGFQRIRSPLFGMDTNPAPYGHSWYKRFGPTVIGVKDRGSVPGKNLAPAITEFSLRAVYDRETKALYGRLTAELQASGQNGNQYKSLIRATIEDASYQLVYIDKNGIEGRMPVSARTGIDFISVSQNALSAPGYANVVLSPTKPLTVPFAGLPDPKLSRFALLTDQSIELSGTETDPGNQNNPLKGKSLVNIIIEEMTLRVEGEVYHLANSYRTVDYIKDKLTLSGPIHFANVDPTVNSKHPPQFGSREWIWVPDWDPKMVYGFGRPRMAIRDNTYWVVNGKGVGAGAAPPPTREWRKVLEMGMRKLDVSWQVNDPLVNSHGSDFQSQGYAPGGFFMRYNRGAKPPRWEMVPGSPQLRRHWVPRLGHLPLTQFTNVYDVRMGVNLAKRNDLTRPWTFANGGDSAIQDPGVGYSPLPHLDWRFPDISRGRIENVGWLGQVHRGTPWQTLYLKSKVPGQTLITAFNQATGVVTAPNHNIHFADRVRIIGRCPPEWSDLRLNANAVKVDSVGNIVVGELEGLAQPIDANTFKLWPLGLRPGQGGFDILTGIGSAPDTSGLMSQNIQYWQNWAGSPDTLPANDRRLLEVFSVGVGVPVRGRFSVNNDSPAAWSAALCGLSVPLRNILLNDNSEYQQRFVGANDSNISPYPFKDQLGKGRTEYPALRDARIDLSDGRWGNIVTQINAIRRNTTFTRVTDILAASQLTDGSPYLKVAWQHVSNPDFKDELDIERIPMQLLSLLRVDDQPVYETYIYADKLRPALRVNAHGYSGAAISKDGTILNYEVAGQTVRRVVYEFSGSKAWHQSIKDGIPGKWRDHEGKLRPLSPLRPVILHSSTLQMN